MPETISAEEFFGTNESPKIISADEFFGAEEKSDSFLRRFSDDLKFRFGEQGAAALQRQLDKDQGFKSTLLQLTGVGAGAVVDFVGEAIISGLRGASNVGNALLPESIEDLINDPIKKVGLKILNSDLGKEGLEAARKGLLQWQEFSEEHPVAAANIGAVVNIGLLVVPVKGIPKAPKTGPLGRAGQAVQRSGRRSVVGKRRDFIDELVVPQQTKKVRLEQVKRTEVTGGLNPKKVVELSELQKASASEIRLVQGVSGKKTFPLQDNYNAIAETVTKKANELEAHLSGLGKDGKYIWTEFADDIANGVTARLKANPSLVGNAETSAQRVIDEALRLSVLEDKTLAGLLRTRRQLDNWVTEHKPKIFEDGAVNNAMTSAVREVRTAINGFIDARATGVRVKRSLKSQSLLLRAMDDIAPKAADEASSRVAIAIQNAVKLIPIRNELVAMSSLIFAVGGLGAAALFLPYITTGLVTIGITYGLKRAVMSPNTRKGIGKLIKLMDKAVKKTTDPAVIRKIRADRASLVELLKEIKVQTEDNK